MYDSAKLLFSIAQFVHGHQELLRQDSIVVFNLDAGGSCTISKMTMVASVVHCSNNRRVVTVDQDTQTKAKFRLEMVFSLLFKYNRPVYCSLFETYRVLHQPNGDLTKRKTSTFESQ